MSVEPRVAPNKAATAGHRWLILMLALLPLHPLLGAEAPLDVAQKATGRLLEALKAEEQTLRRDLCQLYTLIDDSVDPYLDFGRMSELVLGRYAARANARQKTQFADQLRSHLIGLSAEALANSVLGRHILGTISIEFQPARTGSDMTRAEVPATLSLGGFVSVDISYRLHFDGKQWRIYDLTAQNLSLVSTYRSIVADVLRARGLDMLLGQPANRQTAGPAPFVHQLAGC